MTKKVKVNIEAIKQNTITRDYILGYLLADAGCYDKCVVLTSSQEFPVTPVAQFIKPGSKLNKSAKLLRYNIYDAEFISYLNSTINLTQRKFVSYKLPKEFHNIEFFRGYCDGKASFTYIYTGKQPRLICQVSAQSKSLISSISTIIKDIVGCSSATVYERKNENKEVVGYFIRLGLHNTKRLLKALYTIPGLPEGFYNPKHLTTFQTEIAIKENAQSDNQEPILDGRKVSETSTSVDSSIKNTNNSA